MIDIEKAIRSSLRTIKELSGADEACFYLWNEDRSKMEPFYTSSESMSLVDISSSSFPWLFERLKNEETVVIERISEIQDKTHQEIKLLEETEISSLIGLPVYCGNEIEGFLCIYSFNGEEGIVEEDLMLLKVISGILGSAIERQKAEEELRRSFEKLQKSMNTTINAMSKIYENITQKPSRFGRAPGI